MTAKKRATTAAFVSNIQFSIYKLYYNLAYARASAASRFAVDVVSRCDHSASCFAVGVQPCMMSRCSFSVITGMYFSHASRLIIASFIVAYFQ